MDHTGIAPSKQALALCVSFQWVLVLAALAILAYAPGNHASSEALYALTLPLAVMVLGAWWFRSVARQARGHDGTQQAHVGGAEAAGVAPQQQRGIAAGALAHDRRIQVRQRVARRQRTAGWVIRPAKVARPLFCRSARYIGHWLGGSGGGVMGQPLGLIYSLLRSRS